MNHLRACYEFGDFVLDMGRQSLSRRESATAVTLTGKAVEENSLTQAISTVRQVLGEERGENRYIVTLPRKGYRFVAPVTMRDAAVAHTTVPKAQPDRASSPSSLIWRAIAILCVLGVVLWIVVGQKATAPADPTGTLHALAILPFKPLVPMQRNEALELGMTESLIAHLAQGSEQTIRPLSSVRRFNALDQDALAAGRELGVDTVLDGLMHRDGDRLRVSVRLLRVADGRQLWSQNFDQSFTGIFDVQDAIAMRIAQALSWQDNARSARHQTQSPEAFALYASGRFVYLRLTEPSLLQAIEFFDQAVALDPDYARAYAGIADSNCLLAVLGIRSAQDVYPRARAAVEKALALDPRLAPAHTSLGQILYVFDRDEAGAAREYERALELDSNYAPSYFYRGLLLAGQGQLDRAIADLDRAKQLEPYTLATRAAAALLLVYAHRYDEAITALRQILATDDRFDLARSFLMRALLAKGEYGEVLADMNGRILHAPGSYGFVGQALALSGRREDAQAELHRVLERSKHERVFAYDIAMIYAAMDDADSTFLWLDRAVTDSSPIGQLAQEPLLEKLHGDPRFAGVVKKLRSGHKNT
jgi:TolB-like protein/DNA-binding winged helix-turn-helix (wHTH) protein/lipopolysaccharide biosynthesis regulator YciM